MRRGVIVLGAALCVAAGPRAGRAAGGDPAPAAAREGAEGPTNDDAGAAGGVGPKAEGPPAAEAAGAGTVPSGARAASPVAMAAACRGGALPACHELGYALSQGHGVPRSPERAARVYAHACDAGHPPSCAALGVLYADGRGVPLAGDHALWLLSRACNSAFAPACRTLGQLHHHGYAGVPVLPAAARGAFRRACELDDAPSCAALAELGAGPSADPLPGVAPTLPPLGDALDPAVFAAPGAAKAPGGADAPTPSWGMFWNGAEVGVSHRDSAALGLDTDRYAPTRFTWPGLELGALGGQRTGLGARLAVAVAFDLPGAFDDDVSNSARFGGLHLEAALEALANLALGPDLVLSLGAGWHGLSGPLTKNSSLALSLYLASPPDAFAGTAWFLRVTPAQLFASNERELLSPLAVELRVALPGGVVLGAEGQWVPAPGADTEDTPAEGWALFLRVGVGLATASGQRPTGAPWR